MSISFVHRCTYYFILCTFTQYWNLYIFCFTCIRPGFEPIPDSRPPRATRNKGPQILKYAINKRKYYWSSWLESYLLNMQTRVWILTKIIFWFLEIMHILVLEIIIAGPTRLMSLRFFSIIDSWCPPLSSLLLQPFFSRFR